MQQSGGLEDILGKIGNNIKSSFEKIKDKIEEFPIYIRDKTYYTGSIMKGTTLVSSPLLIIPAMAGLYIENLYKSPGDKLLKYALIGVGAAVAIGLGIIFGLNAIHFSLPSLNNIQYLGSQNGYEAFVPNNVINYNGHTDPVGYLILNNGSTINNVIWDGQYSGTIIQNHNQINQLNNQFVGQIDPINNQPYVPLQDFYVIEGQVPVENVTINGQMYYIIEANNINPANIAGFYTYQGWVTNFVEAINTPGTYAAVLPGNSPVFQWENLTGTVAYQTKLYGHYGPFPGGAVLVLPNRTIISYGINNDILGSSLFNFTTPQHTYNPSS